MDLRSKSKISGAGVLAATVSVVFSLWAPASFSFELIYNRGKPARWHNHAPTYEIYNQTNGYFDGGVDHSGTVSDEFQPIRQSFNAWTSVSGIALSATNGGMTSTLPSSDDGHNTIIWIRSGWRSQSFKPPSNALAVTLLSFDSDSGEIANADIYFNAEFFRWAVVDSGTETGYVDVRNIATHEIGHFFGLDHSSETYPESDSTRSDATMYYASGPGETMRRDLNDDDVRAIRHLYGTDSVQTPSLSGATSDSNSSAMRFEISGGNFNSQTSFVITADSSSVGDAVGRVESYDSGSATVLFNTVGFPKGQNGATLYVYNNPSAFDSMQVSVVGQSYASTSSGGGGGCSLEPTREPSSQLSILIGAMILTGILYALRRRSLDFSHRG